MATKAQITANRRNAQQSTGPRTPQGKAAVSHNAVKHGLSAHQTVICSESQEDFDRHRDQILGELAPATPMESILTERVISLSWRLKRTTNIQNQAIDALIASNKPRPIDKLMQSMLSKGSRQPRIGPSESDPELTLGRSAVKDFSNTRVLERLLMYERRIEHSLYKTILEFQRLSLIRTMNP